MTKAALMGACRHMVGMRTTYDESRTVTAMATGNMTTWVPPMAIKTRPTAQPTKVLIRRARKVSMACFMTGSLVATMELMAQIGLVSANSCTSIHKIAVAMKMLTA